MIDPLDTPAEAGLSRPPTSSVLGDIRPDQWSPEMIASLDWMRVAELVRAIAAHSGCELARSIVLQDGSVAFGMIEQPGTPQPRRALVKIAGWNEWGATAESVQLFAQEVGTAKDARGILIAPGGFTPAALLAAQEHRIETVDTDSLFRVLDSLPPERSELFFTIAAAGACTTPTCPICQQKLRRLDSGALDDLPPLLTFDQTGLVADHVLCDRFEVAPGSEVTFLHVVQAREMRISGDASGDFVCDGPVTLLPGGTLTGTIAARSVNVRAGGELRGQFRILEGPLQPFVHAARRWQWLCRGDRSKPECAGVIFEPHEER